MCINYHAASAVPDPARAAVRRRLGCDAGTRRVCCEVCCEVCHVRGLLRGGHPTCDYILRYRRAFEIGVLKFAGDFSLHFQFVK